MYNFFISLIYKVLFPFTVVIWDNDSKKHIIHLAKNMQDAVEWGRCYFVTDVVSIYKHSLFHVKLVATEQDI